MVNFKKNPIILASKFCLVSKIKLNFLKTHVEHRKLCVGCIPICATDSRSGGEGQITWEFGTVQSFSYAFLQVCLRWSKLLFSKYLNAQSRYRIGSLRHKTIKKNMFNMTRVLNFYKWLQ